MALFPAYGASAPTDSRNETEKGEQSWLNNSSFKVDLSSVPKPGSSKTLNVDSDSSQKPIHRRVSLKVKRRIEKAKKKAEKIKQKVAREKLSWKDSDCFKIDTSRTKEFLKVNTISRPSVPRYRIRYWINNTSDEEALGKRKIKKWKRYFMHKKLKYVNKSDSEKEEKFKESSNKSVDGGEFIGSKQEEDLTKTTGWYNKNLAENAHDISMWLKYVHFQDVVYHFEKTYRKGSTAKGLRVNAERKLDIIDKALKHNPDCDELHRERLNIAVNVFPADELQTQLKELVGKDPSNIILWQGYIESTQCSMSHCNTVEVLMLYKKCLAILHKLRRGAPLAKSHLEESILKILYQCGLFLKQTGLFEQLWTLLRLYLELNLSPSDNKKFNINSGFNETQLVELEEVVFKSQLPLHELWLRTEKLRESCHWLPFSDSEIECEDPQRVVFTEDVVELIQPITMPGNMFRLTTIVLTLLKIPLLPCRHATMVELGLDYVPWSLDSIESLLPAFFNLNHIDLSNEHLLCNMSLVNGPQYLKVLPGQIEYLQFILKVMKCCRDCLNNEDKIAVTIWWLRFQRLLIILDKKKMLRLDEAFKKKMKSDIKNLLKTSIDNIEFYCEYALFEKESGNLESSENIIKRMLAVNKDFSVSAIPSIQQKGVCYMYRTLVEILMSTASSEEVVKKRQVIKYLVDYATGKGLQSNIATITTQGSINEALLIFKHITSQILQTNHLNLTPAQHFLPDFLVDWVICNAWLVYLIKGPIECGVFLENTLEQLDDKSVFQKEALYEFYVSVLFKHCLLHAYSGTFKILDDILYRAIELFPNNLFFLSVLAKVQSMLVGLGCSWWKVKNALLKTNRAFPITFLVLISSQKAAQMGSDFQGLATGGSAEICVGLKNKMLSLFQRITRSDICTKRCGLVWRFYLQFVHANFNPVRCRNVYYSAVEQCPWLKALYIDAAIYIPAELAQIQDLIIEKQLRLHITPEELDIFRS